MYFPDEQIANGAAPVLRSIGEPPRRATLIAVPEPEEELRFNIRPQGERETVFLRQAVQRRDLRLPPADVERSVSGPVCLGYAPRSCIVMHRVSFVK